QPVAFRASAARLEQTTARLSGLPDVTLYSVEAGPNELLPDAPWAWKARTLPQSGSPQTDLSLFLARVAGGARTLTLRRRQLQSPDGLPRGSDHRAPFLAHAQRPAFVPADPPRPPSAPPPPSPT